MTRELGWIDTNIFVHTLFSSDPHYRRCRTLVQELHAGEAEGWIDPVVVHELTYVLSRLPQFPTREDVHQYIRSILLVDTIHADDKMGLVDAVGRWASANVGYADAWLSVLSQRRGLPVCSANRGDFPHSRNTFPEADE